MLDSPSGPMARILVVCTGNVCRSPVAEGFLRSALQGRFGDEAPLVASAGTAGWEGEPAMRETVLAAAERGVEISGHIARRLLKEHIEASDLVIAMAGEHRDTVTGSMPEAAARTFTLKELVRLLEGLTANEQGSEPAGTLVRRIVGADALRRAGFPGNPGDEDIADPLGLPLESYRAVAWELDEWCRRLVDGLFGSVQAPAAVTGEED